MTHHRLRLLHCRTADLSAHSALLHLSGCHLNLGRKRSSHPSGHSGGRPWSSAPIFLQLTSRHAWRCSGILRKLSMHRTLIIAVCSRWTCSSGCSHGCRLGWRHAVCLRHARHVALLRVAHLLRVLLMLRASLTVSLRWEDWRCLLVRMHLLLLCRRGYRRIASSWVLSATIRLDMPGRVPMVGLLILRVVGHVRNSCCSCCGCTRRARHTRLGRGVVVRITPNAPLAVTDARY